MRKIYFTLLVLISISGFSQSLRELYQEGLKAYEEQDYALFRDKMKAIDTMRPNFPAVVYNLAGSYVLTNDLEKAIATLNQYILMDATQDFSKDSDFTALLDHPSFEDIKKMQEQLTEEKAVVESKRWGINETHPESITYSKRHKSFFIGGVRDGKIWKIKEGDEPAVFAESPKNSWAVMGLEVSPDEKTLWVCTAALSNYEGYDQNTDGYSSVLKYDIKSGKLLNTYLAQEGHVFGDLIVSQKGDVYISDGRANRLYIINEEEEQLEIFADVSESIFNLQGLTFNSDQTSIYLSDYIDGIYNLEMDSKQLTKLRVEANDILLKGIDGLYLKGNNLLGLHNGTKPNRVVLYSLSEDGLAIVDKSVVAQAGVLGEPTQGVFIGHTFYYIANSPWSSYDQDGNFNASENSIIIGELK